MRLRILAALVLALALPAGAQTVRKIIGNPRIGVMNPGPNGCEALARSFNGTDQYFTGSDLHATGAFTFACWMRLDSVGTNGIAGEDDGTKRDWGLRVAGTPARVSMLGWSGGALKTAGVGGTTVTSGVWYLAAGSYDGTNKVGASTNGSAWIEETLAGALDNDVPGLNVGRHYLAYLPGRLSTCFYVPSKLTGGAASQLLAIYSATILDCTTLQSTYGATHCYSMDRAAGANEADHIGSTDLTQINSPGSADGPGDGCN